MAKVFFVYFDLNTGYYPGFHHGIAYLIGALKSRGHLPYLAHLKEKADFTRAIKKIGKVSPDIIGLSFTTNQKKYVAELTTQIKEYCRLIISGGAHSTLVKEEILEEIPQIDGLCIGEGEFTLLKLCEALDNNNDYYHTPSFYFKNKHRIIRNPVAALPRLDDLPLPDYTLFDYQKILKDSGDCFPMLITRGCPYECSYCCNHILRQVYPNKNSYVRFPSLTYALKVIKNNLSLYPKTKKIIFTDDIFTLNKKWLREFCQNYKKEINLPFICNGRVETIDEEVASYLKSAGCVSIEFGVESGNEWLRRCILNRNHSNEKIKQAFRIASKYGIKRFSYNIVGLPFETKEMARDTLNLNLEIRPNYGRCFYFYPYPGSKLYNLCKEYKFLTDDWHLKSGYLESPSLKEIFMSHQDMREYFERLQLFFYIRAVTSRIKIPLFWEKILIRITFLLKKPLMILVSPSLSGRMVRLKRLLRKLALKYLR